MNSSAADRPLGKPRSTPKPVEKSLLSVECGVVQTGAAVTKSSLISSSNPVRSPRSHTSHDRRTISTFSCDIAYPDSPTASRACPGSQNLPPCDLAVVVPGNEPDADLCLHPAGPAASGHQRPEENSAICRRGDLFDLEMQALPGFHHRLLEPVSHLRPRAVDPSKSDKPLGVLPFHLRAKASHEGVRVASVPRHPPVPGRPRRSPATSPTPTAPRLRGRRPGFHSARCGRPCRPARGRPRRRSSRPHSGSRPSGRAAATARLPCRRPG